MSNETNDSLSNISSISERNNSSRIEDGNNILYILTNFLNSTSQIAYYYREILEEIKSWKIEEFYFCKSCKCSIIFSIEPKNLSNLDKIFYSCNCSKNKKEIPITDIDIINKYKISEIQKYLKCQEPGCNEIFSYFCLDNKKNFCKKHRNEKLNIYELNTFECPNIFDLLNYFKFLYKNKQNQGKHNELKTNAERVIDIKLNNLKKIITTTIENYIKYPNVNLFITIKKIYACFCKYNESVEENGQNIHFEKIIEIIRDKRKLIYLDEKVYHSVKKVDLRQLKIYDGENEHIFNKLNSLENLVDLDLSENCLYSIKPLINAKCKNLAILSLKKNNLNDENIKYFEKFIFKELKSLNLECNRFTQYDLLVAIFKNFKKLEELTIGYNVLKEAKKNQQKKKNKKKNEGKKLEEILKELNELDNSNLKKISAKNGVFNQKTAEIIIPSLHLNENVILDLSYNNLKNLDFLRKNDRKFINEKNIIIEGNFTNKNK